MACGKTDAIDSEPNTTYDWIVNWHRGGKKALCVVTLTRTKVRTTK
jgi:hypothetical protein